MYASTHVHAWVHMHAYMHGCICMRVCGWDWVSYMDNEGPQR